MVGAVQIVPLPVGAVEEEECRRHRSFWEHKETIGAFLQTMAVLPCHSLPVVEEVGVAAEGQLLEVVAEEEEEGSNVVVLLVAPRRLLLWLLRYCSRRRNSDLLLYRAHAPAPLMPMPMPMPPQPFPLLLVSSCPVLVPLRQHGARLRQMPIDDEHRDHPDQALARAAAPGEFRRWTPFPMP